MKFNGVYVASVSPFTGEGHLDFEALQSHLEFLVERGVHGLVPCGTTGESPSLSREERHKTIELHKKVADKKGLKVIAGCGGNSTSTVIQLVEEAKDLGCDAALVVSPYYNKPTVEGLRAHFLEIANKTHFPMVLYNIPGRTCVNIPPALAAELFENPNIVGIKESTGNLDQWLSLAEKTNLSERSLLAGDDHALSTIMALGGSGIISASANLLPEHFVSIYERASEGNLEEAFRQQIKIHSMVETLFRETNPAPIKYGLQLRRGMLANLRLPLVGVRPETQREIEKNLRSLELLP
ncbi:MAG: 4-hydroxy-tetrahydrodipicolinate synthase [Bdellovibrionota bacterium]